MAGKPKPDPNAELHRTLNNACLKWGAREIRLRYLPKPSLNRWIAEALIDHHRVLEKMRADIPAGELTLQNIESFNDQPIARGVGDTASDAIKNHVALAMAGTERWVRAILSGDDHIGKNNRSCPAHEFDSLICELCVAVVGI